MRTQLTLLMTCLSLTCASEEALSKFTLRNNLFTASVYKEIKKIENGNFLVSPFSAETVLALAQSGAKGNTAREIRTSLYFPNNQDEIEEGIKALQQHLHQNHINKPNLISNDLKKPQTRRNEPYIFKTANKIYLNNGFRIKRNFKKIAADVFESSLENVDFSRSVDAANTMNQWVEEQTGHRIKNLTQAEQLNGRTRMVLINALYFKGSWGKMFKDFITFKNDFFKTSTETVQVDTMHDVGNRNFYESSDLRAKFLEMPFRGHGDVSMVIVLPDEKDGLAALEGQLERVFDVTEYTSQSVKVSLPKFKIESQFDFKKILQELGVVKAFESEEADFSGIAGRKGELMIDEVRQKTFIDVSEKGVEAAAATFAVAPVLLMMNNREYEFKADHPFLFYIKVENLIVFVGRVVDPTQ